MRINIDVPEEKTVALVCDKCHRTYNDVMEMQEFLAIDFVGGFRSIFGDGMRVQADICQHCLYEMINDFSRQDWRYE